MACRLQSLIPACAYNIEGIERISLLDFEDFQGFKFQGDDLYAGCLVEGVQYTGAMVDLNTSTSAKYNASPVSGKYVHTIETFIPGLSAENLTNLHLSTKRRYVAFFLDKAGKYFTFGYDAGVGVTYANQTTESNGSLVTISGESIYPLFEVTQAAMTEGGQYLAEFIPDYDNAYCLSGSNSGIKQSRIAYKVSRPGDEPLDIDGTPVSSSGKKQAIALLLGFSNPSPGLYEIEFYFNEGDTITGNPTQTYDPMSCPVGYMYIVPDRLILHPGAPSQTFMLFSANPWTLISDTAGLVTVEPTTGGSGYYTITVTRTAVLGQTFLTFQDIITQQTVSIYIINVNDPDAWVLDSGVWNMLGFWFDNGIWNF